MIACHGMKSRLKIPLLHLAGLVAFSTLNPSCSVEKKLGKEFRETWSDTAVIALTPSYIFKDNLKAYEFPSLDTLTAREQDSVLISNSIFLKDISDSAVISGFTSSFDKRLDKHGFRVLHEEDLDRFMTDHQNGILVNMAQITMEEFVHPYSFDYDLVGESLTVTDIDLNAISFNIWIEISQLNSEEENKVLFTSDFTTDELDGYFRQYIFTGNIEFEYTIDTLTLSEIYEFSERMGMRCADYLYDYFLNGYIRQNVSVNYPGEIKPIHWNLERRIFEFINPERQFLELEGE
jgi:hypothetical protein